MLDSDQNDELQEDYIEPEDETTEEVGDSEVEDEKVDDGDSQSESEEAEEVPAKKSKYVEITDPDIKARVNQLTREKHEAIRAKQELERKLQQLQKDPEPPKEVRVPDADPVTDPNVYAQQQREYTEYIRNQTKFEAEQAQRQQQRAATQEAQNKQIVDTYEKNIARLKLKPEVVRKAENVLLASGLQPELGAHLLEDDDGPALVKYLAANPEDLDEILSMKPNKAIAHIERAIRAKATQKTVSKAPPPPTKVDGKRGSTTKATVSGWSIT